MTKAFIIALLLVTNLPSYAKDAYRVSSEMLLCPKTAEYQGKVVELEKVTISKGGHSNVIEPIRLNNLWIWSLDKPENMGMRCQYKNTRYERAISLRRLSVCIAKADDPASTRCFKLN